MRYVLRDGELVPAHLAARTPVARSDLPCPSIRPDGMAPLQSMADGRMYDSVSAYRASVKAAGCEIVGNDRGGFGTRDTKPKGVALSIKNAIDQLRGT